MSYVQVKYSKPTYITSFHRLQYIRLFLSFSISSQVNWNDSFDAILNDFSYETFDMGLVNCNLHLFWVFDFKFVEILCYFLTSICHTFIRHTLYLMWYTGIFIVSNSITYYIFHLHITHFIFNLLISYVKLISICN